MPTSAAELEAMHEDLRVEFIGRTAGIAERFDLIGHWRGLVHILLHHGAGELHIAMSQREGRTGQIADGRHRRDDQRREGQYADDTDVYRLWLPVACLGSLEAGWRRTGSSSHTTGNQCTPPG